MPLTTSKFLRPSVDQHGPTSLILRPVPPHQAGVIYEAGATGTRPGGTPRHAPTRPDTLRTDSPGNCAFAILPVPGAFQESQSECAAPPSHSGHGLMDKASAFESEWLRVRIPEGTLLARPRHAGIMQCVSSLHNASIPASRRCQHFPFPFESSILPVLGLVLGRNWEDERDLAAMSSQVRVPD